MSTRSRKPEVLVWVLDGRNRWQTLGQSAGALEPSKTELIEGVARYSRAQFDAGVEWSRPIRGGNLVVRIEAQRVVVALGPESTHRLLINTEIDRALRQWKGERSSVGQVTSVEVQQEPQVPQKAREPSPFVSVDEVEDVEFEPVEAELESMSPLSSEEGEPRESASTPKKEPRWQDVANFIATSSEAASDYLGPTVIANYWKQALRHHGVESLGVKATGVLTVRDPENRVAKEEVGALQGAYERWLRRCQRVIPDRQRFQTEVGHPPWEAQGSRRQSHEEHKEER